MCQLGTAADKTSQGLGRGNDEKTTVTSLAYVLPRMVADDDAIRGNYFVSVLGSLVETQCDDMGTLVANVCHPVRLIPLILFHRSHVFPMPYQHAPQKCRNIEARPYKESPVSHPTQNSPFMGKKLSFIFHLLDDGLLRWKKQP